MKLFLFILILFFCSKGISQITPDLILMNGFNQKILELTKKYDSVVLINTSSYWRDNKIIEGVGFFGDEMEVVRYHIRTKKEKFLHFIMEIESIKPVELMYGSIKDSLFSIFKVKNFLMDSINVLTTEKYAWPEVSDSPVWSILFINTKKRQVIVKQTSNLNRYPFSIKQITAMKKGVKYVRSIVDNPETIRMTVIPTGLDDDIPSFINILDNPFSSTENINCEQNDICFYLQNSDGEILSEETIRNYWVKFAIIQGKFIEQKGNDNSELRKKKVFVYDWILFDY